MRSQFSASSLLSATSLILSLSQTRTDSTPWLLVLPGFCVVVDGGRQESSLEDGTSESLRLECNFKQILVNSFKRLLYEMIL